MSRQASAGAPVLTLGDVDRIFDHVPGVVFFLKDRAGRYTLVNETLRQRCGVARKEDLLGKTAEEVFPRSLGPRFTEQDQRVINRGEEIRDKMERHLYPGGTEGWCLTWKAPVRGASGRIEGLVGLSRDLHGPDDRHPEYRRLADAVDFITSHFNDSIRLTDLATKAGMSVDQFERLTRRIFQLSPRQLLAKTRIEAALDLLAQDVSIAEVAHACGYADHSAFTRQFRATTGLTPREHRARLAAQKERKKAIAVDA
jgi:PAS domain S-box-containing protein